MAKARLRPLQHEPQRGITRIAFLGGAFALAGSAAMRPLDARATDRTKFLGYEGFPYEAFDALPATIVEVGGGKIHVAFAPGQLALPRAKIVARIRMAAIAIATYYGRFPVASARYLIVPVEGDGVLGGTTWGYAGAATRVLIGTDTDAEELRRDWVTTHEMVHMALPDLSERYYWLSEGLAVYIEPIARVQAGEMPPTQIWSDMKRDMPKGEPHAGDRGLDNTPTWGRIYWGGAIFCLTADLRMREQSGNRVGLQQAMRGVLEAGGNHDVDWPIEKILATADRAVGLTVMSDLYRERRDKPVHVDLEKIWADLGVDGSPGAITLRNDAPLAAIRTALTQHPTT